MRTYHLFILLVPCFILLVSGCQIPGRSQALPTPQQRPFLGLPTPFESGPSNPAPVSPRRYEEPNLITPPPPPAPAVSSLNRPSKVVRSNRKGLFAKRSNNNSNRWVDRFRFQNLFVPRTAQRRPDEIRFDNPYPLYLSASQFNKLGQQARYQLNQGRSQQVTFDQSVSFPFDQPIALGFDATERMPQRYETQMQRQLNPSLYGQREQKMVSNYSGIENWSRANWRSPSCIEDWKKQQRPRQMTPSNVILPVMSVPQDASANNVEQWPHLERKVESLKPVEVLEAPVFDEDEDHVIIIQPRR